MTPTGQILLVIWLAVLGGCVGSFLHVVVYRLPRGESLLHPGSRCPKCGHAIRWYHNLPVVGWLLLGGRCYDCKARISPRYPLVEAITAAVFALLAYAGPLSAASLSNGPEAVPDATVRSIASWSLYAYHVFVVCLLLAVTLMAWDASGNARGRACGFGVGTALVGLAVPAWWYWSGPFQQTMWTSAAFVSLAWVVLLIMYAVRKRV